MQNINYIKKNGQYIGRGDELIFDKKETIYDIFEKQVLRTPHAVAIRYKDKILTYMQLNCHVNKMSNYLDTLNLPSQTSIALYLNPSIEMIVTILSVLKSGFYYVPIDVTYPVDRVNFMVKDSNCSLIITENETQCKLASLFDNTLNISLISFEINAQSENYQCKARSNDLAYMIYTSGSTGVPKGVQITHAAVHNHMSWMSHEFKFDSTDKVLFKTPLSFDPSVWEIFMPLFNGSELVISPAGSHIDPELLIDLVLENKVTIIQVVPSILKQILNSKRIGACKSLKNIYVGGESLRPEIKNLFFKKLDCRLINLYGPTEATIDITFHEVLPDDFDINTNIIGRPVSNTAIYLINDMGNLAELGESGEIFIGSLSLSKGYHNRDSLTKEFFIANPFESNKFDILYKTGDLAKWLPTGNLEYLGRNNDQVKINGVRIEPKELVSIVLQHKEVSDCIVTKKTDSHGHDYLACYLTFKPFKPINVADIKKHLKSKIPTYMLPKVYIPIDEIPLTANGKVDIGALPEANFKETVEVDLSEGDLLENERELLLIWQMVLEINQIDINDNFFDMGGGSLLALKLITIIHEKLGASMRIRDIFDYPTVKLQAEYIKNTCQLKTYGSENINYIPNPMILLQSQGLKKPLFLIHPIGGTVFWFSQLSKLLGSSRPIYGIQDPSIDLEKPVLTSIEEMASFYLSHIRKIQPSGPYLIGGASFGATIAAEISCQLAKTNESISSIIVLDGWGVYPNTLLDDNYFRTSMLRQHDELKVDFKRYGLPPPEIMFDIQWNRLNLLWKYKLDLIEHPIVLFKSKEVMPVFLDIDAPNNHWENFTNKVIKTILVPGNHETMFQEPHVYELSRLLKSYLIKNNF